MLAGVSQVADSALAAVRRLLREEPPHKVQYFAARWWLQMSMADRSRLLEAAGLIADRGLLSWCAQGDAARERLLATALMLSLSKP